MEHPPIQMPSIDWNAPKAEIRWNSASGGGVFVITVEDFLLCAATTTCEADFRAAFYRMGRYIKPAAGAVEA